VKSWARFLLTVALVCTCAYATIYVLAISPIFCAYSRSFADVAPCYKYDTLGKNVDLLLVGDSSLLYGIKPSIVERDSRVTSYNYGMQGPAFPFDPESVIDRFLKTNGKPRAVVVYFSPWTRLAPNKLSDPQWFPLALLTLRHRLWGEFGRLLLARPLAAAEIPQIIVKSIGLSRAPAMKWRAQMERDDGFLDYGSTLSEGHKSLTNCLEGNNGIAVPYAADNLAAIIALRVHYRKLGLPLYVYVAPIALCDEQIDLVRKAYEGAADNQPTSLPNTYFADDNSVARHSHMNSAGAAAASTLFANFIFEKSLSKNFGQ
jgi:hypothetical protein